MTYGARVQLSLSGIRELAEHFIDPVTRIPHDPRTIRGTFVARCNTPWLVMVDIDGTDRARAFHESYWELAE